MFSADDAIVAIATPPGRGGLGIVRLSGPACPDIAAAMFGRAAPFTPRRATFARLPGLDDVIVTYFPAPRSYTGQDVVEIGAHGSPVVLGAIVETAMRAGARLAEPGEFTLRAFLNGRLDLVQAEAVGDLVDAATPLQARTAFDQLEGTLTKQIAAIDDDLFDTIARLEASIDFPDEGYHFVEPGDVRQVLLRLVDRLDALLADARRGRTIREGAQVVVAGRTNVGKSSLFNYLAGHERAIVTAMPGTTRDLVTERVDLRGIPVTLVDTAGVRETDDFVEREGIDRARGAAGIATLVLVVLDRSQPLSADDRRVLESTAGQPRIVIGNKADLPAAWTSVAGCEETLPVSALTGDGMPALTALVVSRLTGCERLRDTPAISNARHIALLQQARAHLMHAAGSSPTGAPAPEEFVLSDLQLARAAFDEITGRRTPDDVLQHIFERFCIGK